MGRPRKKLKDYGLKEDWKQLVFEMSAIGCSDVEIRAALVWNDNTKVFNHEAWYKLQEIDEEFSETIHKAKCLCQSWWERQGRENVKHDPEINFETGLWYANMKNRFGWRDRDDVDLKIENAEEHFKRIADAISKSDSGTTKVL